MDFCQKCGHEFIMKSCEYCMSLENMKENSFAEKREINLEKERVHNEDWNAAMVYPHCFEEQKNTEIVLDWGSRS